MPQFSFATHGRVAVPLAVYVLSTAAATAIVATRRRRSVAVQLFAYELPRLGAEFSKIGLAVLMGSVLAGIDSTAWLNTASDSLTGVAIFAAIICCGAFVFCYVQWQNVQDRKPWDGRFKVSWFFWLARWLAAQVVGLGTLWGVLELVKGRP